MEFHTVGGNSVLAWIRYFVEWKLQSYFTGKRLAKRMIYSKNTSEGLKSKICRVQHSGQWIEVTACGILVILKVTVGLRADYMSFRELGGLKNWRHRPDLIVLLCYSSLHLTFHWVGGSGFIMVSVHQYTASKIHPFGNSSGSHSRLWIRTALPPGRGSHCGREVVLKCTLIHII